MSSSIEKLDILRNQISEKEDKLLYDEAVICFKNCANRAAYIITWICVAESLRNKFISMARRDADIGKIVGQIEEAEKNERPTDKLLIDKSFELGIITNEEKIKLDHMRNMRNIYAHPTGTGPSADEVIAALNIAVESTLSKPPLMRKGYVQNVLKSIFEDFHFLDDMPLRVREYSIGVARRIHPSVLPYLLDKSLEYLEQTLDDPLLALYSRRGLEFCTTILNELRPNLSNGKWNIEQVIQKYPTASSVVLSTKDIWPLLPEQAQDMVIGHLCEPIQDNIILPPTSIGLERMLIVKRAHLLNKRQRDKLEACCERAPYHVLHTAGIPLKEYALRIITDLSSHDWYKQNPACEALKEAGIKECSNLNTKTQEQLGRNVLQAAQGGASRAAGFIMQVFEDKELWPKNFIEGLVLETMVNEKQEFRFKEKFIGRTTSIAIEHPKSKEICSRVIDEITKSHPKYGWSSEYDKLLNSITIMRQQLDNKLHPFLQVLEEGIIKVKKEAPSDDSDF